MTDEKLSAQEEAFLRGEPEAVAAGLWRRPAPRPGSTGKPSPRRNRTAPAWRAAWKP
jgi:hypothetical protein